MEGLAERELGGQPVLERLHPHEGEDVAGEGGRQRLRRAQAAALEGGPEHALAETAVQARHHVLEDGHAAEELCRLKRAAEAAGGDRAGLEADERYAVETDLAAVRSEERRVGKECRCRRWAREERAERER